MKVQKIASSLLATLLVAAAASAGAQTLTSQTSSLRTGTTNYSTNSGASFGNYDTGALRLSDGSSTFWAYCIDPLTGSGFPNTYGAVSLASFLNGTTTSGYAGQIARSGYSGSGLSNSSTAQAKVLANLQELFGYAYSDSVTSAVKSAAFGMAVWEIIMQDWTAVPAGDGFSRTAGRVRSNGSTSAADSDAREVQTTTYLNALSNNTWSSIGLASFTNWVYTVYYDNTSPYAQSFIKVTSASVPEPATLALAGLALAGIAASRRRAQRRG
jgi:PEP-CTERM motif